MSPQPDIRSILDPLPIDKSVKAAAWDGFHSSATPESFRATFDGLALPKEAKAALWDARFPSPAPAIQQDRPEAEDLPGDPEAPPVPQSVDPRDRVRKNAAGQMVFHDGTQWRDAMTGKPGAAPQQAPAPVPAGVPQILAEEPAHAPTLINSQRIPASQVIAPPDERSDARKFLETPLISPRDIEQAMPFLVGPFALHKGLLKSGAAMTSPESAAIVAGTGGLGMAADATAAGVAQAARVAQAGLSTYFATQAGRSVLQKSPEIQKAWKAGDWQGVLELGGGTLLDAAVAAASTAHAVGSVKGAASIGKTARALQDKLASEEAARRAAEPKPKQIAGPEGDAAPPQEWTEARKFLYREQAPPESSPVPPPPEGLVPAEESAIQGGALTRVRPRKVAKPAAPEAPAPASEAVPAISSDTSAPPEQAVVAPPVEVPATGKDSLQVQPEALPVPAPAEIPPPPEGFKRIEAPQVAAPAETSPALTEATKPEIVTDPSAVQEIRNSITEGEMLLRDGRKVSGAKFTEPELRLIERSVNNSRARIGEPPMARPSVDHGMLGPSGSVSARSEAAAKERTRVELFGEQGLARPTVSQPGEPEALRRQAAELRGLADRGMKPRAYAAQAAELERRAAEAEQASATPGPAEPPDGGAASNNELQSSSPSESAPETPYAQSAAPLVDGAARGEGGKSPKPEAPKPAELRLPVDEKGYAVFDLDSPMAVAQRKVEADAQRLIDYSDRLRPPGGTIGVGKEGVHEGFTGWAIRTLLREVNKGKSLDEAAKSATDELLYANKLQNSRNKDYTTQRWERNGVSNIEYAVKQLRQAFADQSAYIPKETPPVAPVEAKPPNPLKAAAAKNALAAAERKAKLAGAVQDRLSKKSDQDLQVLAEHGKSNVRGVAAEILKQRAAKVSQYTPAEMEPEGPLQARRAESGDVKPAHTEATAEYVAGPIAASRRYMGDESIKATEPDKFFVPYTNPSSKPGSGMKFSLVETEGSNGAQRFNAYRSASRDVAHDPPDASALIRNGKIESVFVREDWRGSGLFGQFMRELGGRGLKTAEGSPKSASYLAAEKKFRGADPLHSRRIEGPAFRPGMSRSARVTEPQVQPMRAGREKYHVLAVNAQAMDLLHGAMGIEGGYDIPGVTFTVPQAETILRNVNTELRKARLKNKPDEVAKWSELRDAIEANRAATKGGPLAAVQNGADVTPEEHARALQEELDHVDQLKATGDFYGNHLGPEGTKAFLGSRNGSIAAAAVRRSYPDAGDSQVVMEVGVRLMRPGRYRELDLTSDQARDLQDDYVNSLIERHGVERTVRITDKITIAREKDRTIQYGNRTSLQSRRGAGGNEVKGPDRGQSPGPQNAKAGAGRGGSGLPDVPEGPLQAKREEADKYSSIADLAALSDSLKARGTVSGPRQKAQTQRAAGLTGALDNLKSVTASLAKAYTNPRSSMLLTSDRNVTDYERAVGKWSGDDNRSAHDLIQFRKQAEKSVPDVAVREAITNWIEAGGDDATLANWAKESLEPYAKGYEAARHLTPEQKAIARDIQAHDAETLKAMQKAGIVEQGVENYATHIYKDNPELLAKVRAQVNFDSLRTNPYFVKERDFPNYFEAEKAGLTPRNKDIFFLVSAHERALREALAARQFIGSLKDGKASDDRPLAITAWATAREVPGKDSEKSILITPNIKSGEEAADYRALDHPSLRGWRWAGEDGDGNPIIVQGDMLVHPEIYRHLKNNLTKGAISNFSFQAGGRTWKPGQAAIQGTGAIKHIILSLGRFHETTLETHALEHRTNPWNRVKLDMGDPNQRALVDGGLMVAHYEGMDAFSEGLVGAGPLGRIPGVGHFIQAYSDHLFKNKLPELKMTTGLHALERNRKRYKGLYSDEKIAQITAKQMNAAFGGLNYRMLGRNRTLQEVLRLVSMAPDFLEARARFVAQAFRPQGREQLIAYLIGAAALYTTARVLNQLSDNEPHWDKPFAVVGNGKEYSMRSVQEDTWVAVTSPGRFLHNRLSPPASFMQDFMEGRSRFGKSQTFGEQMSEAVKSNVPIPVQPWLRGSADPFAQRAVETILKVVGVNVKSANAGSAQSPAMKKLMGNRPRKKR